MTRPPVFDDNADTEGGDAYDARAGVCACAAGNAEELFGETVVGHGVLRRPITSLLPRLLLQGEHARRRLCSANVPPFERGMM